MFMDGTRSRGMIPLLAKCSDLCAAAGGAEGHHRGRTNVSLESVRLPVETKAYLEERRTFPVLIKFEHVII